MVAVVSGSSLGLSLTSMAILGQRGVFGDAAQGRSGEQVFVNVANGNLVMQDRDDVLVAAGIDAVALRTYNSQGVLTDDNSDNWGNGIYAPQLKVAGGINAAGSSLLRIGMDGAQATFTFDAATRTYTSTDGDGAYDTIVYDNRLGQFAYTDGDSRVRETYQAGGKGRLLTRTDADGNSWQFIYHGSTGALRELRTLKEVISYEYTGSRLDRISMKTVDGAIISRTSYGYDSAGRLATVTTDLAPDDNSVADGRAYVTTYSYDGTSKRIAGVSQSDGSRLDFTYVQVGADFRVATVTDALGQQTRYDYDAVNRRTSVTDALGRSTQYEYDGAGQLTAVLEPAVGGVAQATRFSYSGSGDLTRVVDGEGRAIDMEYDARGNQVLQRDALGNTIRRAYNAANQLVSEAVYTVPDADGSGPAQPSAPVVTRYVYDSVVTNRLRFVVSAEGRVTEHRYDTLGLRASTLQYNGGRFDASALATAAAPTLAQMNTWLGTQNPAAATRVDMSYDHRGELQAQTAWATLDALGNGVADGAQSVTRYTYDQAGQLLSMIDANGGASAFTYDGLGRLLSSSNALGQLTLTSYDDAGSRTTLTQASGLITTSAYDRAGRLASVSQSGAAADLGTTRYLRDAAGRLLMTQDPTGVRQWMVYDESGRKVADIDGDGSLVEYVYDKSDRLIQTIAYAIKVDTSALANAAGEPSVIALSAIRPAAAAGDSKSWRVYDTSGRLAKTVDAAGAVTETFYDGASRVVQVRAYANRIATAGLAAQLTSMDAAPAGDTLADRASRNFHDADGLLLGTLDAEGYLTELRYDTLGRLVQRVRYATATVDAMRAIGTLEQLRPAAGGADQVTTLLVDSRGRLIGEVDPEGYLTERSYDRKGNLVQTTRYAGKAQGPVTPGSSLAAIRPAAQSEDRSTSRTYDALDRLASETDPQGTVTTYTYDTAGNLVQTERAAGAAESRSLLARFDLLGRLLAELTPEGAQRLALGEDVEATWAAYSIRHAYDAAGRRTSTTDPNGLRTVFFYDADSRLTFTVDAAGEVSENRYNALGELQAAVQYGSRIDTAGLLGGLDIVGLRAALTGVPQATVASYTYNTTGTLASEADALGHSTQHRFNAFGEETGRTDSIGDGSTVDTLTVRDRRGLQTQLVADAGGIDAATVAQYDAFGRVIRTVDANGNERRQAYDTLGRVVTTTDGNGSLRSTGYDAFGRALTQTDAFGHTTRYVYDRANRTIALTTPEGITVTTAYDRLGQTQTVTDGRGNTTSYTYDGDGKLKTTSNAAGVQTNAYDRGGRLLQTTDAQGHTVTLGYDAANRLLTRTIDAGGLNLVTSYAYDARGRQVSVVDPSGRETRFAYDAKGQLTEQLVDPSGLKLKTTYSYDGRGRTLTVTDPSQHVTRYDYDKLGRRIAETVDPAGLNLTRRYSYDKQGNVTAVNDANGNTTRYTYDAENRLLFTVDATGAVTEKIYDAQGRVLATRAYRDTVSAASLGAQPSSADVRALLGAAATVQLTLNNIWDADGRLKATVNSLGEVVKYAYDAAGNVTERVAYANRDLAWSVGTQPQPAPSAQDRRVRTVYDALNRAIYSLDATGALVAQTYDKNGNLLQRVAYATAVDPATPATDASLAAAAAAVANSDRDTVSRRVYDNADRLVWSVDGEGAVTHYAYDDAGRVLQRVEYASPIAPAADPAGVASGAGDRVTCYAYDGAGRQVFTVDPLGTVSETAYDAKGNVVRQTVHAVRVSPPTAGNSYTIAQLQTLGTNANDRSTRMAYDAADRLVFSIGGTGAVTEMAYDGAGNASRVTQYGNSLEVSGLADPVSVDQVRARVVANAEEDRTQRRAYDAAGRLTFSVDALGFVKQSVYDALGQVIRTVEYDAAISAQQAPQQVGTSARDRVNTFTYDAAGRLVSSRDALNQEESYSYDAVGNRLRFTNKKGATWSYSYDAAGRQREEISPQVETTSIVTYVGSDGVERLQETGTITAGVVTRMDYDALGNLTARTEAAGRAEERTTRYEYDAAGHQVKTTFAMVGVYDGSAGPATAGRTETRQTLFTETTYDAFGNAIANRDVAGNRSYKAYDKLGAVVWDVDALGYVTGYQHNAFGEVQRLSRYAANTNLTDAQPAVLSEAQIAGALNAPGVDHGSDRILDTQYDRAGRAVEITEPEVYVYDSSAQDPAKQYFSANKKTRNTYNAFGDVTRVALLKNSNTDSWLYEARYFDQRGQQVATVDAAGYLTTQHFDAAGNMVARTEFANAMVAWNGASPTANVPAAQVDPGTDRTTYTDYDALNRKASETRVGVEYAPPGAGSSVRGDLTTRYAYDAVGNLTATTDAAGGTTYSYYDALGRVRAVAEPTRAGATVGSQVTPLTEFRRDAYGNVVVMIERAYGAAAITPADYASTPSSEDRTTRTAFDAAGRAILTQDAKGVEHYASFDAHGKLAKQWQGATGADGITRNLFRVFQYDAVGQQTHVVDPAPATFAQGESGPAPSEGGTVDSATEYNAFGEVTARKVNGVEVEYAKYDNAGRVWKTNSGNGVDRIALYDLQGNATAELRSNGDVNIAMLQSARQAAQEVGGLRRTSQAFDALGHVVKQMLPERTEFQGGVSVSRNFLQTQVLTSAVGLEVESTYIWSGSNSVQLSWSSLASLGSGDVKVDIQYAMLIPAATSGGTVVSDEGVILQPATPVVTTPAIASRSFLLTDEQRSNGGVLSWTDPVMGANGGISQVLQITVSKKDAKGYYQTVFSQAGAGYGPNTIEVAAPPDASSDAQLLLRPAGSGDSAWFGAPLLNFGHALRFDARSLAAGGYEYKVLVTPLGGQQRTVATGTLALTPTPLAAIGVPLSFGHTDVANGVLAWQNPGAGVSQIIRTRPVGGGEWTTRPVGPLINNLCGADVSALPGGTYEYELLWSQQGYAMPYAHATGRFTVVPAVPPHWVPPVNLPQITGVAVTSVLVGAQIIGQDENGPVYARDAQGNTIGTTEYHLGWQVPWYHSAQLLYRPYGSMGGWSNVTEITSTPVQDESGAALAQSVRIDTLPAGDYEYWLTFTLGGQSSPDSQAMGRITIEPREAGHYEQREVQVIVQVTITPPPPSDYIIGYSGSSVVYGLPVVVGYDEAGQPIFGDHYTRAIIGQDENGPIYGPVVAVPYTQSVTTTTEVTTIPPDPSNYIIGGTLDAPVYGPPVVVGYDEAGQPIFGDHYAREIIGQDESGPIYGSVVAVPYTEYVTTTTQVTTVPPDPSNYIISGSLDTPVYGYPVVIGHDESGAPIYGTGYGMVDGQVVAIPYLENQTQTQTQDVWVDGAMAAPTLVNQTPPYVPGYTAPLVPAQYGAANDSEPGTLSLSGPQNVESSQGTGLNGDTRVLHPEVAQTTDRWGNVTSVTDVRYAGWKTSYRYDANNHMVEQSQPDGSGNLGASVTRIFYDKLGNQTGVLDANGHLNSQVYDAGGNLVQEIHADGGVVNYNYNAFSERAETRDARGNITRFTYDLLGQQAAVIRLGAGGAGFNVYASGFAPEYEYGSSQELGVRLDHTGALVETAEYDAAGRKISETNGAGETTRYTYDLRGNIVRVVKAGALQQTSAYDNQGRKIAEVNALGGTSSWSYDVFGHMLSRTSLGGVSFSYTYDNARQLVRQTSSIGQVLTWEYDGAGQIVKITDQQPAGGQYGAKVTSYAYDAAGRKILEQTTQDGIVYQDNHIAYDALGRMRWVGDSRAYVEMTYDAVGNRTRIFTHVVNPGETHDDLRFFQYDVMNRQTVVDAYDAAGTDLRERGHILTYDQNGNRTSDTFVGTKIVADSQQPIAGYDESSGAILYGGAAYATYHNGGQGLVTEQYGYDGMGRLKSVERDGIQTDLRFYDGAGRLLFTGPKTNLPQSYFKLANGEGSGGQPLPGTGTETRMNQYDSQGRLLYMRALKNDGSGNLGNKYTVDYRAPGSYDAAGNLKHYVMSDRTSGAVNTYDYTLAAFDGYKESVIAGTSTKLRPGSTTSSYDANGFLTRVDDATKDANDRRFVNDALGQVLAVNQNGNVLRQLIVNGEVLGRYGVGPDELRPRTDSGEPNLVDTADFLFGYRPISPEYPTAAPGSYTVRSGDTLRSIAQTAYGDSRLWYQVADANGLASDADLRVGHTLTLPNIVTGASNAAGTFQPYDPSKVVGDTSPNLPAPKPKKSSWFKKLLVVIVAVIVTIYTAGVLSGAGTSFWTTMQAGLGVMTGGLAGGIAGANAALAMTTGTAAFGLGTAGTLAIASAAGSIVSQAVGVATGAQEGFSWSGVALSAVSGGLSAGLPGNIFGATNPVANAAAKAAIANAVTQGIGVVAGLQSTFDWRGVAASAVGAGVGSAAGDALGMNTRAFARAEFGEQFGKRLISGLAAGAAATAAHGGRVAIQQVAVDAFGNALGISLADAMTDNPIRVMGAGRASDTGEFSGHGMRLSAAQVDGWGPSFNVPSGSLAKTDWDLFSGGTPRLSNALSAYGLQDEMETGALSTPVDMHMVVGRPLPPMAPLPRMAQPESAGGYVYGRVAEAMDSFTDNLDRLGEDPSTSSGLRFAAAMARNPASWIPGAVKGLAGLGVYGLDSEVRSQVNTGIGNFLDDNPIGTTKSALTRYWDEKSGLEIARDTFNLVAGGSIGTPLAKLPGLALGEMASLIGKAGETGLRWSQRLNDYGFELVSVPSMRYQAGAIGLTVRNLRAEVTQMLPEGFELQRISRGGAAIVRYGEDTYYSVPKSQYSLISELRTMDTMGDTFTRRVQTIADRFEPGLHLSDDQLLRLSLTRAVPEKSWLYDKFMSAYKGSYIHDVAGRELPFMKGAAGLEYKTVGPDIVPIGGGPGLRYEMTQLTPSLNAIFSHTKKYPDQLLRYVTYR